MVTYKHQSDLIADFDQSLGKCMRYFQQLESIIYHRSLQLGLATSEPHGQVNNFSTMALSELSFSAKLRVLATLLARDIPQRAEYKAATASPKLNKSLIQEMERAKEAIKSIYEIEKSRNRYFHSWWFVMDQPPGKTELIPITRLKPIVSPKKTGDFEEFPIEKLKALLKDIEVAENEIGESCGRLLGLLNYDEGKKKET